MPKELFLADCCFLMDRRKPMSILDLMYFFYSDLILKKQNKAFHLAKCEFEGIVVALMWQRSSSVPPTLGQQLSHKATGYSGPEWATDTGYPFYQLTLAERDLNSRLFVYRKLPWHWPPHLLIHL